MTFFLGTKKEMTQIFEPSGRVRVVTTVSCEPIFVTGIRTEEKNGYSAVQVGTRETKESRLNKAQLGYLKSAGVRPLSILREFRLSPKVVDSIELGKKLLISEMFQEGDLVDVSAITKGKGFQGVVKRHNFGGGPRSHGQKHNERAGGSIGNKGIARVLKGLRMPGRMGGDRVTVKNLRVMLIDQETNTLYLSGALPGVKGALVEIRKSPKSVKHMTA